MRATTDTCAAWEHLMELDGEKTPSKIKEMVQSIIFELIQNPSLFYLLDEHGFYLREMYRAADLAEQMLNKK